MRKPLKTIPSVVQLPGGVRLSAVPFRVVAWNEDDTPRMFEILPADADQSGPGLWYLFADAAAIRAPGAGK